MAIIGILKATENGYEGTLQTLTLGAKIAIEQAKKTSDNQPDFRVFHVTKDFKSDIGTAWKKTSREGSEYLIGSKPNRCRWLSAEITGVN